MAISERRQIALDAAEIAVCLRDPTINARLGMTAPPSSIELVPEGNCVRVRCQTTSLQNQVDVGGATLAAVLMRWCSINNVPLPRDSTKFLQVTPDSVTLTLERGFRRGRPGQGAEQIIEPVQRAASA